MRRLDPQVGEEGWHLHGNSEDEREEIHDRGLIQLALALLVEAGVAREAVSVAEEV